MRFNAKEQLGLDNPNATFAKHWGKFGFEQMKFHGMDGLTTMSIQDVLSMEENKDITKGLLREQMTKVFSQGITGKTVNATLMEDSIPIRFDPEWIDIFTGEAPLVSEVPERGWNGYSISSNRIDSRDPPIGWVAESKAIDLSGETSSEYTPEKTNSKMKIFVDLVNISDFSQRAGQPFMNMKDTTLGTRVKEHAQLKEQTLLYGDPSQALADGSPGSANAHKGLAVFAAEANTATSTTNFAKDKSGVSSSGTKPFLKDLKKEIKLIKQAGYGISPGDMQVWTSHTMFDHLSNEEDVSARIILPDNRFNFGFETIYIDGIPVIASHNVDAHSYDDGAGGTYAPGHAGDVFIYNKRATQYYSIAPFSMVPLGRIGLADRSAVYEYCTLHEKAGGFFGKYLYDYTIP